MNVSDDMTSVAAGPEVLAEAERWFARLKTSNCSADDRAAFERWHADPGHAAAYAQTEQLWEGIGTLAGNAELEAMSAQALRATDPRSRQQRAGWHMPLALAASVAMCALVLVFALGVFDRVPPPVVYATGPDQRDTVRLADGSQLTLNADTVVAVRMGNDRRAVVLEQGEAMFGVAHDPRRPFRVEAGNGTVTALGTRFQVRHDQAQVTVTLLEGSVALDRPDSGEHWQLSPGDQATYSDSGTPVALRMVDTEVISSWTRGRLLFRSTPLAEVVAEVNRYAGTQLRLEDPLLGALPVSGTFPMGDSESVALALQALLPVRVEQGGDGSISLHRK
ncbi:FecR family protein [Luteimonas saliphila]|uniref:FecR family protein n=1 Tax=Luteimonas saliphila TaxID=2804919 RepID=UPI00192D96F7|nr:FecR family protein [Luteimonas saliphila]